MKRIAVYAFCFLLAGVQVRAQTGTGSIQGTIKDASDAVVPGASISITQTQTAQQRTTTTNEVGYFLIPSVQIGPYEISVSAAGMESWKGRLTLQAGQAAVVDVALKVGATTTEITIAGNVTPLVTTTAPTLATVIERARVEQLPLNSRMVYTLIANTTPGIELVGASASQLGGALVSFRSFGLRYATDYLQDGTPTGSRNWGTIGWRPPGIDSIEEFRTETNNSSAKLARPSSVITTTRAGTNQVHGSVFETARNNGFGVARARQDFYLKPPPLVRNEFGASLGGPVYFPKLYNGRNRTFFFASYEAMRLISNSTISITVPTAAMREGDFSGLVDSQGRRYQLYNPWTTDPKTWERQAYQNNRIPLGQISPLTKHLYSITPLPTLPNDNPLAGPNWQGPVFDNQRNYTVTVRIDHRLSDRDQLFFRYTHAPHRTEKVQAATTAPATMDRKWNAYVWPSQNDGGSASWTHTFSPTLFSELLVNVARDYFASIPIGGLGDLTTGLGLPNPFKRGGYPWIIDTGFNMTYYPGTNYGVNFRKPIIVAENLTKIHGRHQLQFGGRYNYEFLDNMHDQTRVSGRSGYNSMATSLYDKTSGSSYGAVPFTGHTAANFFLGVAAYYDATFVRQLYHTRAKEIAGYFQDDFKVNSRLTLNLGVRYEYNSPFRETSNLVLGFDEKNRAVVVPGSTDALVAAGAAAPAIINAYSKLGAKFVSQEAAGIPKSFVYPNRWDFGPRVGFAYRMGDTRAFVVRGGYAIYSFLPPERTWISAMTSTMPTAGNFSQDWMSAEQSPDGLRNYLLRASPPVIAGVNSLNVLDPNNPAGISRGSGGVRYFNPDQPTSRAHQWNLTLERELPWEMSAKAGYVGNHGSRLDQWNSYNEPMNSYIWYATTGLPLPTGEYAGVALRPFDQTVYGTIQRYDKKGWSNAQAFQFEVQRRYSKGMAFQAYYVMTNALYVSTLSVLGTNMLFPAGNYMPGAVPADDSARNRLLNYMRDPNVPKHRFNYNWLVDLPFGRGKKLGGNANGFLDRIIGGWQIAGAGYITSNWWTLPTSNWAVGKVEIYGKKYPVQDCRTGVCYPGYLYWNGYIPANRINSYAANGKPNGVMGVPSDYTPSNRPLIPTPANGGSSSDPLYAFYETNTVWLPLKSGAAQRIAYNDNLNPWRNQYNLGPMTYMLNASVFKSVRIRESLFLRFNADFFNALNLAGTPQPSSDGIIQMRNSANVPRQLQLTARLTW